VVDEDAPPDDGGQLEDGIEVPNTRVLNTTTVLVIVIILLLGVIGGLLILRSSDDSNTTATAGTEKPNEPGPHLLAITFTLNDTDGGVRITSDGCHGTGGFSDVEPGMTATITDAKGTIIGTGDLLAAEDLASTQPKLNLGGNSSSSCHLAALVPLKGDTDFYQVEIGHRGKTSYSKDELASRGWQVDLSLG
jgi:hypothetical protein